MSADLKSDMNLATVGLFVRSYVVENAERNGDTFAVALWQVYC
jgi:hypothetical protein